MPINTEDELVEALRLISKIKRRFVIVVCITGALALLFAILYIAKENGETLTTMQTKNSVEIVYETQPYGDSAYLILTHKKIYCNDAMVKNVTEADTVPNPGYKSDVAYNSDDVPMKATVPKEYEFFVTIK